MFNLVSVHSLNAAKNLAKRPEIVRTLKTDIPFTWERPKRIAKYGRERSGDVVGFIAPDPSNICLKYQYATELENAEPMVRNQFTLGWHPLKDTKEFYEKTLMDSVRSHIYDYKSRVAFIAQITGTIRFYQFSIEENHVRGPRRKFLKSETGYLIRHRAELIRRLREVDYKQYEWLLERLDLQYKPKPQNEDRIWITRKEGLRQLTKAYCDDLKQQKLDQYRHELESQQVPFLEQKLKNLEFIRNEQREMKVPMSISQEQIDEVRQQYEQLKIKHDAETVAPTKKKWKVY